MKSLRKNLTIIGAVSALAASCYLICGAFASTPGEVLESRGYDRRSSFSHEGIAVSIYETETSAQPGADEETSDEGTSVVERLPSGGIQITYYGGLNDGIVEYIFPWCAEEYLEEYGLQKD